VRIHRLLVRLVGNADDAFDLAQETYFKAFSRMDRFDGRSSWATWLYRIALNEAFQHLRRRRSLRIKLREFGLSRSAEHEEDTPRMQRLDLEAGLSRLSALDRAILVLRYQDGLDYRTIAQIVGRSEGTVASRLNRARDRLRAHLRDAYGLAEETSVAVHPIKSEAEA
jgi:RNA polymerase sigma-70 factor (ECF subfamily)